VDEPLLEHPRAFGAKVARVLDGRAVESARLTGFLSSGFDAFLNQLFAAATVTPREAAEALDGRPGFVWLAEEPAAEDLGVAGAERVTSVVMRGMTATTASSATAPSVDAEIVEVRSHTDLGDWHEVYCEVFGVDPRGRDGWHSLHDALGPSGDGSLALLLARVGGAPAATAGVYFDRDWAGLYCFTTRERLRGRGLASALVHACHERARARGVERALLHATALGRPVYSSAGYAELRSLPLLVAR
jgi:GNAT superfamily N-acetyltransferase